MTKTLSTKFYKEIRDKLPQAIIDGVLSYDTTLKVEEIGLKHKLQIDQIGTLVDIIQDIGYGILASKDFLETLKSEIELPNEELMLLASDINEQIFKPVRAEILKAFKDEAPNKPRTIATIDEHDTHHETLSKEEILSEIENPHPVTGRKEGGSGQMVAQKIDSEKLIVSSSNKETPQTSTLSSVSTLPTTNLPDRQVSSLPQTPSAPIASDIRARLLSSLGEDKLSHVVTMKRAEVASEQIVVNNKKEENKEVLSTINVIPSQSSPVSPKLQALSEIKTKIKDPFRETLGDNTMLNSNTTSPQPTKPQTPTSNPRIVDPYREPIN